MSYEQQNWVTGNRITAEKLNHMEQGISSAGGGTALIIRYDHTEVNQNYHRHYFDKTWQEVANALTNFTPVYVRGFSARPEYIENPFAVVNINSAYQEDEKFYAEWSDGSLQANSADGVLYYLSDSDS